MHVSVRCFCSVKIFVLPRAHSLQAKTRGAAICCGLLLGGLPAFAVTPAATLSAPPDGIDMHLVADLEQRALSGKPAEQAFLYADLADKMTLLASHQIAEGQIEEAEATLVKLEACTARMETNFQQSKSLKKTELLLHMTNRRLTDMVRAASYDMKPHVQSALQRLNVAQNALLALIFAK